MRSSIIALLALILGSYAFLVAPAAAAPSATQPPTDGVTLSTALSSSDAAALLFMREEEKLARDVYQTLAKQWSLNLFTRIAASEQAHMDALKTLLDRYGLADPTAGKAPGVFSNPDLQALYTQLIARGSTSLPEALAVGAAIEEIDILDLQQRNTASTPADINQVYQRLLDGSYNHLRAFARQWENQTGKSYQPQYLDAAAYQAIMAGSNGNGNSNGSGSGNGNGRGNGNGNGRGRP